MGRSEDKLAVDEGAPALLALHPDHHHPGHRVQSWLPPDYPILRLLLSLCLFLFNFMCIGISVHIRTFFALFLIIGFTLFMQSWTNLKKQVVLFSIPHLRNRPYRFCHTSHIV